jgi:CRP/FNR family transcriptional regulator, cyclic AMP receptor protein
MEPNSGTIIALRMDDLDFSKGFRKPAAPAAPVYDPEIARAFFASAGKEEAVAAGGKFFVEQEKASRMLLRRDKMYLLLEGEVTLAAKGKVIRTVKPGEIFGELAAMTESPRSAGAAAKTACRVIALDDKGFQAALAKKPEFALMMMSMMILRLRGMLARLSAMPARSAEPAARETRVFDKGMLEALANGLGDRALVKYQRDHVIMEQGHAGNLMYVVLEGRVAISMRGAVVERVGPGGVFGEMALVDQSPRSADAAAETDCTLLAINRTVFLNLVKTSFGVRLLTAIAERVRNTAGQLE